LRGDFFEGSDIVWREIVFPGAAKVLGRWLLFGGACQKESGCRPLVVVGQFLHLAHCQEGRPRLPLPGLNPILRNTNTPGYRLLRVTC
jgi:hypothetical protein